MTVTEFLDTKLDKDIDDVIFVDSEYNIIVDFDYDKTEVVKFSKRKVLVVNI